MLKTYEKTMVSLGMSSTHGDFSTFMVAYRRVIIILK
jgi:hypothetical protein